MPFIFTIEAMPILEAAEEAMPGTGKLSSDLNPDMFDMVVVCRSSRKGPLGRQKRMSRIDIQSPHEAHPFHPMLHDHIDCYYLVLSSTVPSHTRWSSILLYGSNKDFKDCCSPVIGISFHCDDLDSLPSGSAHIQGRRHTVQQ
jgi:hypothetical protein